MQSIRQISCYQSKKDDPSILNNTCFKCNKYLGEAYNDWRVKQLEYKSKMTKPSSFDPYYLRGKVKEKDLEEFYNFYKKICPYCGNYWWLCLDCNFKYDLHPPETCPKCGEKLEFCPNCRHLNKVGYVICDNCGKTKKVAEAIRKTGADTGSTVAGFLIAGLGVLLYIIAGSWLIGGLLFIGGIVMAISNIVAQSKVAKVEQEEIKKLKSEGKIK